MPPKFGPKSSDHPSIGEICKVCGKSFKEGDYTTLIALGPSDDEQRTRVKEGRSYNAVAVEVHWDCCASEYKDE